MKQILINNEEMQIRVAVVQDGVLQDFFMERTNRDQLVGSIFKGRIKNLEPSLQAAFVDIGCGKNAFLHYWDMLPATQDMLEDGQDETDTNNENAPQKPVAQPTQPAVPSVPQVPNATHSRKRSRHQRNATQQLQATQPQQPIQEQQKTEAPKKGFLARILDFFARRKPTPVTEPAPTAAVTIPPAAAPTDESLQKASQNNTTQSGKNRHKKNKQNQKPMPTVEDIPNLFKVDQEILVQVTKGPIGTKGSRVTTNLSIPGRYLVLLPNSPHIGVSRKVEEKAERERLRKMVKGLELPGNNMGLICRTVGEGCKIEHFQRDLDMLVEAWQNGMKKAETKRAPLCVYQEPDLAERALRDCLTEDVDEIVTDSQETYDRAISLMNRYSLNDTIKVKLYQNPTPIFQKYNLNQQIDGIYNRKVNLPGGGYICIDETEALIAIDVNTGKNKSGKDQPETILATNLEAVAEIARQIRLRNVGGLVVLDLIDMADKKDQQLVYKTLKEHLAKDRARTRAYPISPLGLLEMTRQRENESLESSTFDNCPYCKGRGLVKSTTSMSVEIQRKLNEVLAKRKRNNLLKPAHPFKITANPKILERFKNEDKKVLQGIEDDYNVRISLQPDPSFHIEEYKLHDAASGMEL
jgi:ribonuclease G